MIEVPDAVRLIPLTGLPEIEPDADLAGLIREAAAKAGIELDRRIVVVCQKIISKAEGRLVRLADVVPSKQAREIGAEHERDPRQVEIVLQESKRIVRRGHGVLITETHHGFVCANAGVDLSNAPADDTAVLLPEDADASARGLRDALRENGDDALAVIVSDTFGRPWREGLVDVAIGCAGLAPVDDLRGRRDWMGRDLAVTTMATADQFAAAAGLLMEKGSGIPAVWIDGLTPRGDGALRDTLRDSESDLFR
jgi:coenzyme F420-0:L-glutamate ligase/coenzyme F420-1:gamma-L-glutamate ligase